MVMDGPSPQSVGREFVRQYYTLLNQAPLHLHRFYSQESSFVHGGLDNDKDCQPVHGQQEIHQRIMQLNFRDCKAKIRHVDAHATLSNGVVVQVSGELSNNGQPMRRFMQTFVLAPQSPKKYYVHNDIFRYQDEVFSDDEVDEDVDETATTENERNLAAASGSASETSAIMAHPPALMKPAMSTQPGTSVGVDGIATVSIAAVAPSATPVGVAKIDPKKDVPHLNGGHGHHEAVPAAAAPVAAMMQPHPISAVVEGRPVNMAPGLPMAIRPPTDLAAAAPSSVTIVSAAGQPRGVAPPQPAAVISAAPVASARPIVNHAPEAETADSGDDSGTAEEKDEEQTESEGGTTEKPAAPVVEAAPEPRGPPTYANLVKSGPPALVSSSGSLPPAGFGSKPNPTSPNQAVSAGAVGNGTQPSAGQAGRDKDAAAGFGQGGMKFRGNGRASLGGAGSGRGGSAGSATGSRDRYSFQKEGDEGSVSEGQDRRRTIGGGPGAGSGQYPDSQQLFVGNLPHNCTEDDLKELFGKYGKVAEVRISSKGIAQTKTTASGQRVPNFGFVVFEDERSVNECLREKPIHLSDGHRLNVETKKNNKPPTRSDGQAMGSLTGGSGSSQTRGSQEHLGGAGRGSDRPRGGSRGGGSGSGPRGGGRVDGGGRGGGANSYTGSSGGGQRGGSQAGGDARGPPQGSARGGSSYSRRS